jgi:chromosome segregation ATPase
MSEILTIREAKQALSEAQKALSETTASYAINIQRLQEMQDLIPQALSDCDAEKLGTARIQAQAYDDVLGLLGRRMSKQQAVVDQAEEVYQSMFERPERYKAQIEAMEAGVYGKKQQAEELKSKIPSMKQRLADLPADMALPFRVESRFDPDELRQQQHSLERSITEDLETIAWLRDQIKVLQG